MSSGVIMTKQAMIILVFWCPGCAFRKVQQQTDNNLLCDYYLVVVTITKLNICVIIFCMKASAK